MSDQPETLAAVIAELRTRAEEERDCGWDGEADDLLAFADRIEAAAERERTPPSDGRDPDKATVHIPHETTGEILAEMRRGIRCGRGYDIDDVNRFVRDWAARIQIATERDLEACRADTPESVYVMLEEFHNAHYSVFPRDELTERLCHAFHDQFAKADSTTPGNADALREALHECLAAATHLRALFCNTDPMQGPDRAIRVNDLEPIADQIERATAALSAPARNCDRFKTLDEAREAFQDLRGHKILADVELWDSMDEAGALVRWLFAPAKGGEE